MVLDDLKYSLFSLTLPYSSKTTVKGKSSLLLAVDKHSFFCYFTYQMLRISRGKSLDTSINLLNTNTFLALLKFVLVLGMCLSVLLGAGSSLWATSPNPANKSSPPLLDSLRIRYVGTGQLGYVSLHLETQIRPLLAKTTQLIFGSGRQENKGASYLPDSDVLVVAVGRGIRRYMKQTAPRGIWLEVSLAIAYVSVSFEKSQSYPLPETDLSGAISGSIGYSWLLSQGWTAELLAGVIWPSLYPRVGVIHSLEPDFFAGFSLASTF
jgi:hypothetical protein